MLLPGWVLRSILAFIDSWIDYPALPFITTARWGIGKFEIHDLREYIQRNIYYLGYYEIRETRLFRKLLRPGDVFVDIGANMGWFTVLAGRQIGDNGHVFSFEPAKEIWRQLCRSVEINALNNVTLERIALSDKNGTARLTGILAENAGRGSIMGTESGIDLTNGEEVLVQSFDEYWGDIQHKKVRLVKIDVEGAEWKVLNGMKIFLGQKICDYLMIEISDERLRKSGMRAENALNLLRECGYKLFEIGMFRLTPIKNDQEINFANVLAVAIR